MRIQMDFPATLNFVLTVHTKLVMLNFEGKTGRSASVDNTRGALSFSTFPIVVAGSCILSFVRGC